MSFVNDSLYDAIEECILNDIQYIDSTIFSESTTGILIEDMFRYIDHLVMRRRTDTPDYVILNTGTVPQQYTYVAPYTPRGAI